MKDPEYYNRLAARISAKRTRKRQKLIEDVKSGLVPGKLIPYKDDFIIKLYGQKGYIPYSTKTLVKLVTKAFDRNEQAGRGRICYINSNRGGLQIKGKHLNRLKKKIPDLKQKGNILYQEV